MALAVLLAPPPEAGSGAAPVVTIGPPAGQRSEELEAAWSWSIALWAVGLLGSRPLRVAEGEDPTVLCARMALHVAGLESDPIMAARLDADTELLACEQGLLAVREARGNRGSGAARSRSPVRFSLPLPVGLEDEDLIALRESCQEPLEDVRFHVDQATEAVIGGHRPDISGLVESCAAFGESLADEMARLATPRAGVHEFVASVRPVRVGDVETEIRARVSALGVDASQIDSIFIARRSTDLAPPASLALELKRSAWDRS